MIHNSVNCWACKFVFPQTQPLNSSIDLKHFCKMYGSLLSNTLIIRVIDIETLQGIVVPVEDTRNYNHAVSIYLVIGQVELLQWLLALVLVAKQQCFGDTLP